MATMNDFYFQKGRLSQYLHERGYPVHHIPEGGVHEDGWELIRVDRLGKLIIENEELVTDMKPWKDPKHWAEIEKIMRGEW